MTKIKAIEVRSKVDVSFIVHCVDKLCIVLEGVDDWYRLLIATEVPLDHKEDYFLFFLVRFLIVSRVSFDVSPQFSHIKRMFRRVWVLIWVDLLSRHVFIEKSWI